MDNKVQALVEQALERIAEEPNEKAETLASYGQVYLLPYAKDEREKVRKALSPLGCFTMIEESLRAHPNEVILFPARYIAATAAIAWKNRKTRPYSFEGVVLASPELLHGIPSEVFQDWHLANLIGSDNAKFEQLTELGNQGLVTRSNRLRIEQYQQIKQNNCFSGTQLRKMSRLNAARIEQRKAAIERAEAWAAELRVVNGN